MIALIDRALLREEVYAGHMGNFSDLAGATPYQHEAEVRLQAQDLSDPFKDWIWEQLAVDPRMPGALRYIPSRRRNTRARSVCAFGRWRRAASGRPVRSSSG